MAETDTGSMRSDANWFIRDGAFIARTITRCLTRVKVTGALDAVPRNGPMIIVSNHASNADGVIVGAWLIPRLGRRIHWLGKREMTRWPIVGPIVLAGSVHPVDRDNVDIDVFRLLLRILEAGNVVVVFPEGTRSATGVMQAAKDGVAMLALRSDARILPVGVVDTDRFWPKGKLPRLGGHVEMRVGEPFKLSEVLPSGLDRRAAKAAATELIMRRIAALLPARQQGVYGTPPASPEPAADGAANVAANVAVKPDPEVSARRVR
jgi:1-acyl-sn-glycerol-3-phosphate acyltransferase